MPSTCTAVQTNLDQLASRQWQAHLDQLASRQWQTVAGIAGMDGPPTERFYLHPQRLDPC
eukprot:1143597-Pelagomonas_calceolata.AAC.1